MTKAELLTELRQVIDDTVRPFGWSDTRLSLFLAEGQDRFCEQTGYWIDRTTFTLTLVDGQQAYPIDSRIINIKSIWDGVRKLTRFTEEDKGTKDIDFSAAEDQRPNNYQLDGATGTITFLEPVLVGVVLTIRAHRKSLVSLTAGDPEIPENLQLGLVEYAAYKAFSDHDRELQDPIKAKDHYANFKMYVREGQRLYRRLTDEYTDIVPNPLYVV